MLFCCANKVEGKGAVALLLLRLLAGTAFVIHGWPKFQNASSWMGPDATIPAFLQVLAAASEFLGGLGLIVGLLTPIASLGIFCTMAFAVYYHASQGHPFVGAKGGPSFELAANYLVISLVLLLRGPGAFSLDAIIFRKK